MNSLGVEILPPEALLALLKGIIVETTVPLKANQQEFDLTQSRSPQIQPTPAALRALRANSGTGQRPPGSGLRLRGRILPGAELCPAGPAASPATDPAKGRAGARALSARLPARACVLFLSCFFIASNHDLHVNIISS